jgi:hypothetical protein
VLIVVTIETQQFPVAAVGWIVIVVVVLVVYRKFTKFFSGKFPSAMRAYPGINLECSFPISLLPEILVALGLGDELLNIWVCLLCWHWPSLE